MVDSTRRTAGQRESMCARSRCEGMRRNRVGLSILLATCLGVVVVLATSRTDRADGRGAAGLDRSARAADAGVHDTNSAPPATTAPAREPAELGRVVSEAVDTVVAGTRIGLAVYDRRTETFLAARNAEQQFYAASVVKLLITVDALQQAGGELPPERIRDQLVAMLSVSDDGIATALWQANGGREIDRRMIELIGLSHTVPPRQPDDWELTRTSPLDVVATNEFIENGLPDPAGDLVAAALMAATNPAADGFDQFFAFRMPCPAPSGRSSRGGCVSGEEWC
jgi:hypothetical protein